MQESPIFMKSHDMIKWLLEHTTRFPKSQRFVMARRVEDCMLDFYDSLIAAAKDSSTSSYLRQAYIELERLKHRF